MIDSGWRIEEPDPDEDGEVAGPLPTLASLDFLRDALRRRAPIWIAAALIGLLAGVAFVHAIPAKSAATVTLLLSHDPQQDPSRAMATDVSLLSTRAVAQKVIDKLHLDITPDDFISSMTAYAATDQVLVVQATAASDASAVARTQALAQGFLDFRAAQLRAQTDSLVQGYNLRVAALQDQVATLTQRIADLDKVGAAAQNDVSDAISQRGQVTTQINALQQTIQDATLRTTSVVSSSHIIDPASAEPKAGKRRTVLAAVTGLIGGLAIGIGIVLFLALTSGRLRRREEVAEALGVPVRISVRRVQPRWPAGVVGYKGRKGDQANKNRQILVHTLARQLPSAGGKPLYLSLISVDSADDAAFIAGELVASAHAAGTRMLAIDLSRNGDLTHAVDRANAHLKLDDGPPPPVVHRPRGIPLLAEGPLVEGRSDFGRPQLDEATQTAWNDADCVLTLADVDPAAGAQHLASWADDAIVLVTAGQSSAERLRTTAELIRGSAVDLRFAVLLRTDRTDNSLGLPDGGESLG